MTYKTNPLGAPTTNSHPDYLLYLQQWTKCRDCYRGEDRIKEQGYKYLPATPGQKEDGADTNQTQTDGYKSYIGYRDRARFHNYLEEAVQRMVGMIWHKKPDIVVPKELLPVLEKFNLKGEDVYTVLRKVHEEQLITGRLGILVDVSAKTNNPYAVLYVAEDITNWAIEDDIITLNESGDYLNKDTLQWEAKTKHRLLKLEGGSYKTGTFESEGEITDKSILKDVSLRGNSLAEIPFVFINSQDTSECPHKPPLLGLAESCIGIYRLEADYRQALFMQSQDTLVVSGGNTDGDEGYRVGAGASIELPLNAKAEFIGVSSTGLAEQRQAIENDRAIAAYLSGQVIDTRSRQRESGDALKTRVAAQATSLTAVSMTSAYALEKVLRFMADLMGIAYTDKTLFVKPNLDFAHEGLSGRALVEVMQAKVMGAPISMQSIHALCKNKELTELEFEDEMTLIEGEPPLVGASEDDDEGDGESGDGTGENKNPSGV